MKTYGQYCALARGLDLTGDRWTLLILRELLSRGPSRYADLLRGLPGIATNLLASRLRDMEFAGLVRREELPRPTSAVVISLTPRGAALEGVIREYLKWNAPAMGPPTSDETFRAHWLLLPLRALCRDNSSTADPQIVRVGTLDDGCDIHVHDGVVEVLPAASLSPDAIVDGDPGALVALFAGQLPVDAAAAFITGDPAAVRRVIGGVSVALAGAR